MSRVADFIKRGAIQLSHKYRRIAVPPELPPGGTFLDELRKSNPHRWQVLEQSAREDVLRSREDLHIELTFEEFNEWLLARGCSPKGVPPTPFQTWREYWDDKRRVTPE